MEPQQSSRVGAGARRHFIGEWVNSVGGAMLPSLVPMTGEAVADVAVGIRWITVQSASHAFPF